MFSKINIFNFGRSLTYVFCFFIFALKTKQSDDGVESRFIGRGHRRRGMRSRRPARQTQTRYVMLCFQNLFFVLMVSSFNKYTATEKNVLKFCSNSVPGSGWVSRSFSKVTPAAGSVWASSLVLVKGALGAGVLALAHASL